MTSVITPTSNTNQPKEKAINAIQEQATVSPFRLEIDTTISNRTKVARLAKAAQDFDLVTYSRVGKFYAKTAATYPDHHEVAVIRYHHEVIAMLASAVGKPFIVRAAYFNRDGAIAYEYSTIEANATVRYFNCDDWRSESVTVDGEEFDHSAIRRELFLLIGNSGDQAAYLRRLATEQSEERAEKAAHEAAIAEAHATRTDYDRYNANYILKKAERVGGVITTGEDSIQHRKAAKDALNAIVTCYERELFTICEDLNKTRTEAKFVSRYRTEADRYGFVTVGEVAAYILTRWVEDGFGDVERAIRNGVAREFVRSHLS